YVITTVGEDAFAPARSGDGAVGRNLIEYGAGHRRRQILRVGLQSIRDPLANRARDSIKIGQAPGARSIGQRHWRGSEEGIHAIENSPEAEDWDEWRRRLFHEVEGQLAFIAWRAEHGNHAPHVHKAERAAFAAALALFAQPWISHAQYRTLVTAMAEALPWLLPERPPAPAP